MAADATGTRSVTNTLSTTTADTITLQQAWPAVEIENHSETVELWARFDGTAAVADANECERIAPGSVGGAAKLIRQTVGPGGGAKGENVVSVVGNSNQNTVTGAK
jgi:hypothetical protein